MRELWVMRVVNQHRKTTWRVQEEESQTQRDWDDSDGKKRRGVSQPPVPPGLIPATSTSRNRIPPLSDQAPLRGSRTARRSGLIIGFSNLFATSSVSVAQNATNRFWPDGVLAQTPMMQSSNWTSDLFNTYCYIFNLNIYIFIHQTGSKITKQTSTVI